MLNPEGEVKSQKSIFGKRKCGMEVDLTLGSIPVFIMAFSPVFLE